MKKITLLLICLVTFSFSNVLTSNEYIFAKSQYKIGNYQSSYTRFYKLFLKYSDNVQINYYLAMSAMQLKQYDDSIAAFERVLIIQPEFHRARLEYARVLYILGFKKQAKEQFLKVASMPIPKNVRKNINAFIKKIDDDKMQSSTFLTFNFGFSNDDNINNGIDYASYVLPGFGNLEISGQKPIESTSYITSFEISSIKPLSSIYPIILKQSGQFFYKNQTQDNNYNFKVYSYKPSIFYNDTKNASEYSLQLGFDKVYPGDKNNFFTFSFIPQIIKAVNKNNILTTYLKYRGTNYDDTQNNDKNYSNLGFGSSWKWLKLKYSFAYDTDRRTNGNRTDINKNIISNTLSFNYDIQPTLQLFLQYQYRDIKYLDTDVFFTTKREDTNKTAYVGLTQIVNKKDFISLSYSKSNNQSNQAAYNYDKDVVTLNYTWRFKL